MFSRFGKAVVWVLWASQRAFFAVLGRLLFARTARGEVRRIVVFRTGQLGDAVVALPALNHIRTIFQGAHISLMTDRRRRGNGVLTQSVVSMSEAVDEYVLYDPSKLSRPRYRRAMAARLRAGRYDLVIYLGFRTDSFMRLFRNMLWWRCFARFRHANGFVKTQLLGRLEERFLECHAPTSEVDRLLNNACTGSVDVPACRQPRFGLRTHSTRVTGRVLSHLSGRVVCAVAPGSKMPVKRWGVENFRRLGQRLLDAYPELHLLIIGGPDDRQLGEQLQTAWGPRASNVAGSTSLKESCTLLKNVHVFVGNDSGAMHLAAAAGVPCVAIFTARGPKILWEPYGPDHRVIRHEMPCHYCLLEDCLAQEARCIQSIKVDEVYQAAADLLESVLISADGAPKPATRTLHCADRRARKPIAKDGPRPRRTSNHVVRD